MRKILLITTCLLIGIGSHRVNCALAQKGSTGETITVISSPDLINLAQDWVKEYSKLNPNIEIHLQSIEALSNDNSKIAGEMVFFVSNAYKNQLTSNQSLKIVIGTEAVIPIINESNPFIDKIRGQGLSIEELRFLLSSTENIYWGKLIGEQINEKVNLYLENEQSLAQKLIEFADVKILSPNYNQVSNPEDLLNKVRNDKYALGFCKLSNIISTSETNGGFFPSIKLVPIDFNNNNKIDYNENFYSSASDFTRGLMIGKYPKLLSEEIYLITPEQPKDESQISFITWILTEGQLSLNRYGFADLAYSQRKSAVDNLTLVKTVSVDETNYSYVIPVVLVLIVALAGLFFSLDYAFHKIKTARTRHTITKKVESDFTENSIDAPKGIFYDKTHTWAFMRKNGEVEVGIDDFLQHITGCVSKFKMKSPGDRIRKGEILISIIQNGKQVNIYSPLSGEIKECNHKLNSDTGLFNSSPFSEGWIYTVEPSNWLRETQFMIVADRYKEWIKNEYVRFKEFLANSIKENTMVYGNVALQDGGEIKDHVLQNLGPEVWEDFQTKFIDTSR